MVYSIYRLTSPSGRVYIGMTKHPVGVRWRQHIRRANAGKQHPLLNAIRKYGPDSFTIEVIDTAPDLKTAQSYEYAHISATPDGVAYNISPGGEGDGEAGAKAFWNRVNTDSAYREAYLSRLREAIRASPNRSYDAINAGAGKWRERNPREAYKLSRRAIRIANRNRPEKAPDTRPLIERLRWKHNRSAASKAVAAESWARKSEDERTAIGKAISESKKEFWDKLTDATERSRMTSAARAAIDRSVQGQAASAGIKRFWAELKKDPARYAEYIERRKASLAATLEKKRT